MKKTAEFAWKSLKRFYDDKIVSEVPKIRFDETKKTTFIKRFCTMYRETLKKMYRVSIEDYSEPQNHKDLDRHKQAAILIYCVIEENVFVADSVPDNCIFVGNYSIALALGLSYMKDRLNEKLTLIGEETIDSYSEIITLTCDTPFFDVVYRNLYLEYENKPNNICVFTLSNTLFLYEYITLLNHNIDLKKLKEHNDLTISLLTE